MDKEERKPGLHTPVEFTSALTRGERTAVWFYILMHLLLLPLLFTVLMKNGVCTETWANFGIYATGFAYMLVLTRGFLRRDFDALCDRPIQVIAEILGSYGVMLCCNMFFGLILGAFSNQSNPNNAAITGMAVQSYGPVAAMAVYFAPVVEELLFRAGIFGTLRRHSRAAAYIMSILCFSVYHVWSYALTEPFYWIYVLQYIPVSFLLARCYESTNSIWTSIFLHMLINGISLRVLTMLEELL